MGSFWQTKAKKKNIRLYLVTDTDCLTGRMSEAKELQKEREKIEENVAKFTKLVPKSLMYLFKNPEDFELHRIDNLWEESISKLSVDSMKMFLEFVLLMKPITICQLVECFDCARDQTRKEAKTSVMPQPQNVFELKESRQERKARRKRETRKKDQCLLY